MGILRADRVIGFTGSYISKTINAFEYTSTKAFSVLNLDVLEKARGENIITRIVSWPNEASRGNSIQQLVDEYLDKGHVIVIDEEFPASS